MNHGSPLPLRRRELLAGMAGVAALPFIPFGCGKDSAAPPIDAASNRADADVGADPNWASGGTSAMTDKAGYPNPFTAPPTACLLVATTTAGPCITDTDLLREDVSEGWSGLPMRLALKVVDTACAPLVGATVKIWHTNLEGIYSGNTPSPAFCSAGKQAYIAADFFRGVQTTDAAGVVFFDTCYPGWYPGRAIHVHFQIKQGDTSTQVSQLFFPEDVTRKVFTYHPEYKSFGQPDTVFATDGVFAQIPPGSRDRHLASVARMSDGAMLASAVLSVV